MKIALVYDAIYPYNKGGKEKRIYDITNILAEKDYDIHIYSMKWWNGSDNKKDGLIYLHGISKLSPLYIKEKRSIKQGGYFGVSCLKLLKENFDIIDTDHMPYFHLFPLKIISLIKRKPLIVTWNEVWGKEYWIKYLGNRGIFGYLIEKMASYLPDKIISISNHTSNRLESELKVSRDKIATIEVGIDTKLINKVKPTKKRYDLIYAGRLLNHKNIDLLIRSVNILKKRRPEITCLIIGNGPEKENLRILTEKLGLVKNVIFIDFLDQSSDLYALMKSSKLFVLPSTREGFGIVVIEANACGIPVITIMHKENASKDLIKEGENGFISKFDENDLANKIDKGLKSQIKINKKCIESARNYDWDKIIPKIEQVYKGI